MKLSRAEEALMNLLWQQKKAAMKDLLELYPEPRPAPTTVATLLKRMTGKGYIGFTQEGRTRQYYPLVPKTEYFSRHVNNLIKHFFNDSASQFASFFTRETDLNREELEELRAIIEKELKNK